MGQEALVAALEKWPESGVPDKPGIAYSLRGLGWAAHDQGDCAAARALYEEGVAIFRELGDQQGIADVQIFP